ncbi:MAG: hypothetical protein HUK21_05925 [Fibrobacteraceae bacterium]|nr:hypothetical protein [Fibrobacteraceae bacterium]
MALLLSLVFFAFVVSAVIRRNFSYGGSTFEFKEHPVQFVIVVLFFLGCGIFCMNRFING